MRRKHAKKIIAASLVASVLMIIFTITSFQVAQAADVLEFKPQVPIPGMSESEPVGAVMGDKVVSTLLPRYIEIFYNYGLSVAGILAAVMLMAGGTLWLVSGGDSGKVGQAKDIIAGSLIGLVLLFSAYIILNTINPELLKMKPISIDGVGEVDMTEEVRFGCCICAGAHNVLDKLQFCESGEGLTPEDCKNTCKRLEVETYNKIKEKTIIGFSYVNLNPEHKWDYKCGVEPDQTHTCVEYKSQSLLIFSNVFNPKDWLFDPGIEKQVGDISPELAQLLNCMRANLPSGVGKISSISDSGHIGSLQSCNETMCYNVVPKCVHSCSSCHYGGGLTTNKSYAVDFGDEINMSTLIKAAKKCDNRAYTEDEGNHLHVSASKCPRN